MFSLRSSILWRILLLFVLLLLISAATTQIALTAVAQNMLIQTSTHSLQNQALLLAQQATSMLKADPSGQIITPFVEQNAHELELRISIYLKEQRIAIDSQPEALDVQRLALEPEMQQALAGNTNSRIRRRELSLEDALLVAVPLYTQDKVAGALRLSIPLARLQQDSALLVRNALLLTIAWVFLAGVLASLLIHQITHPLRLITRSLLTTDDERLKVPTQTDRLDEIGQLTRAVNQIITRYHAQIETLSAEQTTFSAVLSHMTDGIIIVDRDGTVKMINPAAQSIFNISEQEAINKRLVEVVRHHQLVELWQDCIRTGTQQSTTLETTPDRLSLEGIATTLGETLPGSILLLFRDLTRLRRLEMVRRDFVSNVSHELRTPLASLKALAETLNEGALEDPPAARRFLKRMDSEIDNLTQMVQELLELSRIESGRVPLERTLTFPSQLIHSAIERMQLQAERAAIKLHTDCDTELPAIYVDPQRLEQVMINLLHNAIKFTPPGGEIKLSAYQEANNIVFYVKDSGVGIAPEALERIFERFYKADRSRSGGGTGLGLSIARHLVEAHGGKIWAQSQPGKGSTFYFSIPK
ncbi:MAG: PAS domain-containing protein [Anaerolineae bacterium]|nr:PAS domain-containing protein [Anaerolineae bacterium]